MTVKSERGFTIIELLIVGIIVCVLATLVAMTYSGVQAKNYNAGRQVSIDAAQNQLESYYAKTSQYPNLAELNSTTWRQANAVNLSGSDMADPQWKSSLAACTVNGQPAFSSKPTTGCYAYQATTADGSSCATSGTVCAQYTLTASLENHQTYVKTSLN
jgi:prepilin-type N-terminal cleavage/methylation domain-containing protein